MDASSSWGLGGVHGRRYFSISHRQLRPFMCRCPGWERYPRVPIAWLELLAAVIATREFATSLPRHIWFLYSDNESVVAWLKSRRPPHPIIGTLVAAIEHVKYHSLLKISARYISSRRNRLADRLSRNRIPRYLRAGGSIIHPNVSDLAGAVNCDKLLALWNIS